MIELILNIIAVLLFLSLLWIIIYYTWGTDLSGTNPSAVGTTTMIFIIVLTTLFIISGIILFILDLIW